MQQRPDDGIQNFIEALANIFAQKPQHMISVLLEQPWSSTSVPLGISQVLNTIQFDCYCRVPFESILRESDIVSLHCPLAVETRGLIGARYSSQSRLPGHICHDPFELPGRSPANGLQLADRVCCLDVPVCSLLLTA